MPRPPGGSPISIGGDADLYAGEALTLEYQDRWIDADGLAQDSAWRDRGARLQLLGPAGEVVGEALGEAVSGPGGRRLVVTVTTAMTEALIAAAGMMPAVGAWRLVEPVAEGVTVHFAGRLTVRAMTGEPASGGVLTAHRQRIRVSHRWGEARPLIELLPPCGWGPEGDTFTIFGGDPMGAGSGPVAPGPYDQGDPANPTDTFDTFGAYDG